MNIRPFLTKFRQSFATTKGRLLWGTVIFICILLSLWFGRSTLELDKYESSNFTTATEDKTSLEETGYSKDKDEKSIEKNTEKFIDDSAEISLKYGIRKHIRAMPLTDPFSAYGPGENLEDILAKAEHISEDEKISRTSEYKNGQENRTMRENDKSANDRDESIRVENSRDKGNREKGSRNRTGSLENKQEINKVSINLVGIVQGSQKVAIISIGSTQVYLSEGESKENIKVMRIEATGVEVILPGGKHKWLQLG